MNASLRRLHWLLSEQFGIDLRRLARSLRGTPAFFRDLWRYRQLHAGKMKIQPCLHDRYEEGGSARGEYFFQDLHVARKIHAGNPRRHVDIGSRIDGFVAHVASYREVEVFDVRPVHASIPAVVFRQADLMLDDFGWHEYCDSLSCLHALEHFGLGRYGDALDAEGSRKGLHNMARILQPGGVMYLSVPIGIECTVFNANRILDPAKVVSWGRESDLLLEAFAFVEPGQSLQESSDHGATIERLRCVDYALGIFTFRRLPH